MLRRKVSPKKKKKNRANQSYLLWQRFISTYIFSVQYCVQLQTMFLSSIMPTSQNLFIFLRRPNDYLPYIQKENSLNLRLTVWIYIYKP